MTDVLARVPIGDIVFRHIDGSIVAQQDHSETRPEIIISDPEEPEVITISSDEENLEQHEDSEVIIID